MFETLKPAGVIAAALIAPPSGELICALEHLDITALDGGLQVDLMVIWERITAWVTARQLPVIAVVGEVALAAATDTMAGLGYSLDMPYRACHAEIGCALRLSERGGQDRLEMAQMIAVELPTVHTALLHGDISYRHAVAIAETAQKLDDPDKRHWIAATVLPKARHQTVPELRRRLHRLLIAANPKTAAKRHAEAVTERTVEFWPLQDGMAELRLTAAAADIKAAFNAIDAAARLLPKKTLEGTRIPIDARRADAMITLIAGTAATDSTASGGTGTASGGTGTMVLRPAAAIHVTIDLPTLLGVRDNPAELAGYGPIPAPAARALAADGKWRRLICDPLTGALLDLGTTSYTPNTALQRYINTRDTHCTFTSCSQPAHRCEIDHTKPYHPDNPDTGTNRRNLGALCKHHHDLKQLVIH